MKTPNFWYRPPGLLSALLLPLSCLYGALRLLRFGPAVKTATPLIIVGNVIAGGAGKTPVVLALTHFLQKHGLKVHLIAKGYGGREPGPLQVDLAKHTAADVGDEPLLLAPVAPTFIGKDRGAAYALAAEGADIVISDDGLQSPRLAPALAVLVVDGVLGFGNGCLIPAGPLREPLGLAYSRVQAVVQIGGTPRDYSELPVLCADFMPRDVSWLRGARVVAFAGIGQPEKFFATCTVGGATLVATHAFADHHPYREAEIRALIAEADAAEAILVTTTKDAVRLPPALRSQVRVIEGELVWRNPAALSGLLGTLLRRKTPS